MMVQANQEEGVDSGIPTDYNQIPITTQPSSSRSQKKRSRRKQRKDTIVTHEETHQDDSVLDLEKTKSDQAIEIASLKKRVNKLERRRQLRTTWLKRLKKVGSTRRIESSEDKDSLGAQEDASKKGRSIEDLDADAEVTLLNETQERKDEDLMFDTGVLDSNEMFVDAITGEKEEQSTKVGAMDISTVEPVTTAGEVVTTASEAVSTAGVEDSVAPIIQVTTAATTLQISKDELTLAQTLMEIKGKAITTTATIVITGYKAKGVSIQEPKLALRLHAEEQAELEKIQRERTAQEEASKAAIEEELDDIQAMIEADKQMAKRLQLEEQEKYTIEEKARMLAEMITERKRFFVAQRAAEIKSRPPT
ncbi:hypothetical protein Tco_0561473 [Tanacetum coccineum]